MEPREPPVEPPELPVELREPPVEHRVAGHRVAEREAPRVAVVAVRERCASLPLQQLPVHSAKEHKSASDSHQPSSVPARDRSALCPATNTVT